MADTLKLEIVTPYATVVSQDVEMVTLPSVAGQIGILPQHVRLITQVEPGEIVVQAEGHERHLAIGEGIVKVSPSHVVIATDMAIPAEQIDEAMVEEARARAEARLREKIADEEVASVNASLVRSLAQLQVKRRRRS